MPKKPEILAIIPAKLHSTRLPKKSIRLLLGKPLIAHVIEAALSSHAVTRTVVTTESDEIAQIAIQYGADVPFIRPAYLSQNGVQVISVVVHALAQLDAQEGYVPDAVVLLHPTSPLILSSDIDGAVDLFYQEHPDIVIGVSSIVETHPYWAVSVDDTGGLSSFMTLPQDAMSMGREDYPEAYRINGAIYVAPPSMVPRIASHPYVDRTIGYMMPPERSIDIDTELDFKMAELFLAEQQKAPVKVLSYGSAE